MGTPDAMAQYKLFTKYYNSAYENDNLKDYQTANQLREKIVPQVEAMLDDENKSDLAPLFEIFSEFLFEYYLCLDKEANSTSQIEYDLKSMSEKAIQLNENSFVGHYFLTVHHSFHLSTAHAGGGEAIYKGRDAAETIVGTAFSLLGKGLTLGFTAAAAGVSKSNFTTSARRVIEIYQMHLAQEPIPAGKYFKMTSRMFNLAEFCENANNSIWRDIYTAIKDFDVSTLDYSAFEDEIIDEAKEKAMEMIILADSKV
jgi:hypothetical protein